MFRKYVASGDEKMPILETRGANLFLFQNTKFAPEKGRSLRVSFIRRVHDSIFITFKLIVIFRIAICPIAISMMTLK